LPKDIDRKLSLLANLRVVLVSPKHPGNVGMAARAMTNCAMGDLRLVSPRAKIGKEAYILAVAGKEVLDNAGVHDSLLEAVADCGLVIGTTRRKGALRQSVISPEECADMMLPVLKLNKAALVFGPEDTGLETADLSLCHWVVGIHTGAKAESFNLSHSVAIMSYLVNRAVLGEEGEARKLATAENQENMFADIERFLCETGFIKEADPSRMMVAVRRMLFRSGLSEREVKIVRGILRQARWRIETPDAPLEGGGKKPRRKTRPRKKED